MVKQQFSKKEQIDGLISNLRNLQSEHKITFKRESLEIENILDTIEGFRNNKKSNPDLNLHNGVVQEIAKDFCIKVIDFVVKDMDKNKSKEIDFHKDRKLAKDLRRKVLSNQEGIGNLMDIYHNQIIANLKDGVDSKKTTQFFKDKKFWIGIIIGSAISFIISWYFNFNCF